jgi:hypothetical protein
MRDLQASRSFKYMPTCLSEQVVGATLAQDALCFEAADGASPSQELTAMAQELAESIAISGRLESFVGIIYTAAHARRRGAHH